MRKWLIAATLALIVGTGFTSHTLAQTKTPDDTYIRLHVIANSDSETDQAVKHRVRDAILERYGETFAGEKDIRDAKQTVESNLTGINTIAEDTLAANGMAYSARTEYGVFSFPTRQYGDCVLPAGDYHALRVVLGDGGGANWWCVLFPPLCVYDTSAHDKATDTDDTKAKADGSEETEQNTGTQPKKESRPVIKFKIVEWIKGIFAHEDK